MASDVFYDEYTVDEFDLPDLVKDEIFLTGGIMSTNELYLHDPSQCQDTSSSDSGISTVDDLQDIANITDLNSILDTDFKDLDFSMEYAFSKFEHDLLTSDADVLLVKSEPPSPETFLENDYIYQDDIAAIKDEGSPLTFQEYQSMDDPLSLTSSTNQTYTIKLSSKPLSPQDDSSSSSSPMLQRQTLYMDPSFTSNLGDFTYINTSPVSLLDMCNIQPTLSTSTAAATLSSSSHFVPSIKQEKTISILPSPREMSALVNGDVKSTLPITLNIDSILNSKIKIKPKPGSEVIIPAGSTQWMSTRATNQVPVSSHQTISMVTPSTNISGGNITAVTDDKSMKRAQRIIKNRESASLSRKKKKEYMTSLEDRLQQCRGENERLQKENENLRQRLQSLQQENSGLKYPNLSPAKKICLMCVGCLLVVNISLFSFISAPTSTSSRPDVTSNSHITGRHLMSMEVDKSSSSSKYNQDIPTNEDMWSTSVLMQFDEELSLLAEKLNITGKLGNMCPMYFNSTESNRLAEQLRMWMISHEEEKKKTEKKQQNKKKDYPPLRRFGPGSFRQQNPGSEIHSPTVTEHIYSVQVFSGGSDPRQKLLNAISRRNDTFYVFSFSTDYFLIPATAHNKTMRPRMSLLMPVVTPSVNETTNRSQNSIGMMQIDCEILSTNIINVHRSAFPEDNHYNSTSYKHQENSNKPVRNSNNASMHPKQKETNITDKIQEQSDWGKLRKSRSG